MERTVVVLSNNLYSAGSRCVRCIFCRVPHPRNGDPAILKAIRSTGEGFACEDTKILSPFTIEVTNGLAGDDVQTMNVLTRRDEVRVAGCHEYRQGNLKE